MLDEFKNVLCDRCEEGISGPKAYRIDYDGCYHIGCALEIAKENLTNTARNIDVSIDSVDIKDFVEEY